MAPKPPTEATSSKEARESRIRSTHTGALLAIGVGLVVTVLFALVVPLVMAMFSGAFLAALVVRRRAPSSYGLTGSLYLVGLGVLSYTPVLSTQATGLTRLILLVVGILYLAFLTLKSGVKIVLRNIGQRYFSTDTLSELWDVGVSSWSIIYIVWNAFQLLERVIRSIAISILGPGSMITNILVVGSRNGFRGWVFDVSLIIFVVCVMLSFHTLATWHSAAKLKRSLTTDTEGAHSSVQLQVESMKNRISQRPTEDE
ncbi:hypothetical protein [Halorarum salinum]|uniref:Uncharacterized protein n=1 Tax=Halorarum salinum TaxID=2743089 RepID=A0A7D5L9G7_9EURY|nr:hypothetical protein [Halobaculum salinum]QLG61071.1 hypothetical protein HUG12_04705 [Halobaculum salinum]